MARITLQNIDLEFTVGIQTDQTVKSALALLLASKRHSVRTIKALQSVSLAVASGDRIGLIGANGAGKSTLLKVMAGIYPPTRGSVTLEGHVCPLFEFATGFEMEGNGWDNIRTRALLLGMSWREINAKIQDIAAFSGLGDFLDVPVRCYSSGMLLRLAFATSTAVDPQILLLDEVMAAGDASFIESARKRMNDLMGRASIVVFATHNLEVLPRFCDRSILLDHGQLVADGPTSEIVHIYRDSVLGEP